MKMTKEQLIGYMLETVSNQQEAGEIFLLIQRGKITTTEQIDEWKPR